MKKSGYDIKCRQCFKIFYIKKYHAGIKNFCSKICYSQWQVGKNFPNSGQFKKGQESFNKGTKGLMKPNKTSFKKGHGFIGIQKHQGYIMVYAPNHPFARNYGYVMQHRLIMEEIIGRYLKPEEVVHHMNHIRDDNRPENLMLIDNESAHQMLHEKIKRERKSH